MGTDDERSHVDLSAYENAGYIAPGRYLVDVYMNQNRVDNREIEFRLVNGHLQPVLVRAPGAKGVTVSNGNVQTDFY